MDIVQFIEVLEPFILDCLAARQKRKEIAQSINQPRLFQKLRFDRAMRLAEGASPREWHPLRKARWAELAEATNATSQAELEEIIEAIEP